MALSATNIAKTYRIFGIPQNGNAFVAFNLTSLYGPSGESFDFSTIVTALNTKLAAISAEQQTLIEALLTRWDSITSYDPLTVGKSGSGASGDLVNYPKERSAIRMELCNIIGFYCPEGGFHAEHSQGAGVSR